MPERSAIYKEMRDAEFVLRYFTFRDNWDSFTSRMTRSMDRYMSAGQHMSKDDVDKARADFLATIEAVEAGFGDAAFKRWDPQKKSWWQQVLASLYDAEMFACRGRDPQLMQTHRSEIVKVLKGVFSDEDFRRSIDAATNRTRRGSFGIGSPRCGSYLTE